MDGAEVLRRLRQARVTTPVLILSGLSQPKARFSCLASGADDYLTKPFDRRELVARIQAIVRRSKGHAQSEIRTGKLAVNLAARTVSVDDQPLHLTGKEYGILELLSLRKGTTLTKEMFLNHLYGGLDEPELKIVDVFICKLRKKLATATRGDHYIETVWGRGYVLRDPEQRQNATRTRPSPPEPTYVEARVVDTKRAGRCAGPPSAETGWFRLPCRSRRRRSECVARSSAPPGSSAASRSVRRS